MALTKTKSLSISVVVLSVLLAVALTATIVLAGFSFTAKASNTLSFASQVSITATNGLTSSGQWEAYLVNKNGTIGNQLTANTELTQGVALAPIRVKNNTSKKVIVAVAVVITANGSKAKPALNVGTTTATGTTALADSTSDSRNFANGTPTYFSAMINNAGTAYQWAQFTLEASGQTGAEAWLTKYINTGYTDSAINALADTAFTATLYFAAVYETGSIEQAIQSADISTTSWTVS